MDIVEITLLIGRDTCIFACMIIILWLIWMVTKKADDCNGIAMWAYNCMLMGLGATIYSMFV